MKLFTVIDFETTGLSAIKDQITEIGAIKIDEHGNEYGRFHTFVKLENGNVPSKYAKVTEEQCATGLNEEYAIDILMDFIDNTTVIAQYAPFDLSFIFHRGFSSVEDFICTRALTHMLEPTENPSLAPTCERLGIKMLDAHRAIDDVLMTIQVFLKQKAKADSYGLAYENTVVDFKNRPLTFTPKNATVVKED